MTKEEELLEANLKLKKSVFHPEEEICTSRRKTKSNRNDPATLWKLGHKAAPTDPWPITERLRAIEQVKVEDEEVEIYDWKRFRPESSRVIETVCKENVFNKEITEKERDIIAKRVALQQRQFAAYEQREKYRKAVKIKAMFGCLTEQEIEELLNEFDQDEDEVISRLTEPDVLKNVRRKIALKYMDGREENHLPTIDQMAIYKQLAARRSTRNNVNNGKKKYHLMSKLNLDEAVQQCSTEADPKKAFEGWSAARITAYKHIESNPNGFYYRFNAPGETQKTGPWDEDEDNLFLSRLAELDNGRGYVGNFQWGIFSMGIPGRVGYQCSSHYRLLVQRQKIIDPNYIFDAQNKPRFLFTSKDANGEIKRTVRNFSRKSITTSSEQDDDPPSSPDTMTTRSRTRASSKKITTIRRSTSNKENANKVSAKTRGAAPAGSRKRRRARRRTGDDDDNSGNFTSRARITVEARPVKRRCPTVGTNEIGLEDSEEDEDKDLDKDHVDCPLPGFLDPITLEQVVKPAISKYGHVIGYDSWLRCLHQNDGPRDICPLTKKRLTKRDLVILTSENIEEYRDKIVM